MPARKTKTKSRRSATTKRIVRHNNSLLSPYEHFSSATRGQQLTALPNGNGGIEIGFAPAGQRKSLNMNDLITGGKQQLKPLTEDQYLQAVISQRGETDAFMADGSGRYNCLKEDYRNVKGRCVPKPVTGMDQFLPVIERDAYVPRPGIFGGSNQVVSVPGRNGSQQLRMRTSDGSGNSMLDILSNNGSQNSGGFYHKTAGLVQFYGNPYIKNVPQGYVASPNYIDSNGANQVGKYYAINDTAGMRRDGYKLGRLADGRLAATPLYYANGPSKIAVQAPLSWNTGSANAWNNRNQFPPQWPGIPPAPIHQQPRMTDINNFRSLGRRF